MNNQAEMTFRVESDLSVAFTEQVASEQRPMDEVMQEMMRAYLVRARETTRKDAGVQQEATRSQRQYAVNFARASVGLEGLKPSAASEKIAAQYVNGEITMADFVHAVKASIKSEATEQ